MVSFIKKHWQGMSIALIAVFILYQEFNAVGSWLRLKPSSIDNPFFVATGKWGIRFLLLSLLMSPLYTYFGWRFAPKLRKPLGLVAFLFVCVHVGLYIFGKPTFMGSLIDRLTQPTFIIFGVIAFIILALMAITSFKFIMKRMGRFWKPLHRLVYLAGILMMLHSTQAILTGKRIALGGPKSLAELNIYVGILAVLLIIRVPIIRNLLLAVLPFAPQRRKSKRKRSWAVS